MEFLRRYKYFLWVLYFTLCLYCFVDAYQTKLLFDLGAYELNPFLRWLMDITGTWYSILIYKYIALVFLGSMLTRYSIKYNKHLEQLGGA